MKTKEFFLLLLYTLCITAATAYGTKHYLDHKENLSSFEENTQEQWGLADDYVESVPTVYDILQERRTLIEDRKTERIYLTMPEVILTDILLQHGTSLSWDEIVSIYRANPDRYNAINSTMKAKAYIDSLDYKNDSIPGNLP